MGVTMNLIQQILGKDDLPCVTSVVDVSSLEQMQCVFITNAAVGVRPVASIANVRLHPDSEVLKILQREYAALPGESL